MATKKPHRSGTPTRSNDERPTKMVTITMPEEDRIELDRWAKRLGETRSGFILQSVRERIARQR